METLPVAGGWVCVLSIYLTLEPTEKSLPSAKKSILNRLLGVSSKGTSSLLSSGISALWNAAREWSREGDGLSKSSCLCFNVLSYQKEVFQGQFTAPSEEGH